MTLQEKLFAPAGDWMSNACLGYMPHGSMWGLYADGYKRAGDSLVDGLDRQIVSRTDFLVYPIAFLYRHYMELRLKQFTQEVSSEYGPPFADAPRGHSLVDLWREAEPWWCRAARSRYEFDGEGKAEINRDQKRIAELIGVLHELDPTSEGFRYPFDSRGRIPVPNEEWINLARLRGHVNDIDELISKGDVC